jgi:hypothetical protein
MALDIFKTLEELELTIVELYSKARSLSRLRPFVETFQMMETVSFNHSQLIREAGEKVSIPTFDKNAILIMHRKMRDKLWNDIMKDEDENSILKKMATSEESVGKLYLAISSYYQKLSDAFKNVSNEIQGIAQEEFEHRDALLKLVKY